MFHLRFADFAPECIGDLRRDKRIDFVGGIRGLDELERRVDSGEMAVAFAMFPTPMAELMAVADVTGTVAAKAAIGNSWCCRKRRLSPSWLSVNTIAAAAANAPPEETPTRLILSLMVSALLSLREKENFLWLGLWTKSWACR